MTSATASQFLPSILSKLDFDFDTYGKLLKICHAFGRLERLELLERFERFLSLLLHTIEESSLV
jgi:hypothetical protein